LIGVPVGYRANNLCCLPWLQRFSRGSALTLGFELSAASFPVHFDPFADGLTRHPEQSGRFLLCFAFLYHRLYGLATEVLLGGCWKGSGIFNIHVTVVA
jgi:hypothetical protein